MKIKKALGEFWVVGKYGFGLGCLAGGALGFCLGAYESIRMRSLWPLPLAMMGSAFTFGCIFAVSTVIRADDQKSDILMMEVIYFDNFDRIYKRKSVSVMDKFYTDRKI